MLWRENGIKASMSGDFGTAEVHTFYALLLGSGTLKEHESLVEAVHSMACPSATHFLPLIIHTFHTLSSLACSGAAALRIKSLVDAVHAMGMYCQFLLSGHS